MTRGSRLGLATVTGDRDPCVVRPASTQGPYYVDEKLERSDIRSDPTDGTFRDGATLDLTVNVSSILKGSCAPIAGAIVDLWQCDAVGVYSDAEDPRYFNTVGKKFPRGHQITDKNGAVKFTTIYPAGTLNGRRTSTTRFARPPRPDRPTSSPGRCTLTRV